ncbi:hypothetical protein [Phenylobacterium sp.]|uniref:VpaChn25_0724 family phage protein n=1 Tax=Phenylobacterium sp. TaxID=1871053 RepID=UPI00392A3597
MQYGDHHTRHLRITLLRLMEQPPHTANSSLLCDGCDAVGLPTTRDRVKTELAWLAEQGLVRTATLESGLVRATLTERGLDVARGLVQVPGVKAPGP